MKIVVNKCYGGFGLSPKATEYYLKLKGKDCFFYEQTGYAHNKNECYEKRTVEQAAQVVGVAHVTTIDMGDSFHKWPKKNDAYFTDRDIERSDPLLIKTVEDLGETTASGQLAELRIIEIPDGIEWHIDDYDGIETVHENHRSW